MKLFGGFHGNRSSDGQQPQQTEEAAAAIVPEPERDPVPPAAEPDRVPGENPAPAADAGQEDVTEEMPAEKTEEGEKAPAPLPAEEKGPGEAPRKPIKSSAEEAEIEEIIAAYQKKKKRRRLIALIVVILLAVGGVVLWRTTVKPPEIVQPTVKPTAAPTPAAPTATPDVTPSAEETPPPAEPTPAAERQRRENVYTFLLVGRDQIGGNTDTLMVGVFDAAAGTVDVVSIPRDTCANVESDEAKNETKKISAVYARADIEGLTAAVADMVGFPIDCYVSVGVGGFVSLVDTIGGVNFNIPHYMNYDDPTQDLHIHFSAGEQYISGSDAIKVVRWRQNNDGTNYGDIDRIQTQQNFLKTVLKKCLSLNNLVTNLDDYIKIFQDNVKTDLSTGNMTWFAKEFLKLDMDNVRFHTMPSKYNDMIRGFAYGTIYVDEWLDMLNEYLNVYNLPITAEDIDVIYRDENGDLAATSGEIRGGMDSFLRMEDYVRRLEAWNRQQAGSSKASGGEASGDSGGETAGSEAGSGESAGETGGEASQEPAGDDNTNGGE
ncbi:MAG: LCP family protein [Oscillospiraceae bacterium]|nr:LCP family protein [Oscillospiraceae bacterium]